MPKYSYTVINQEGQKLSGTTEAESEQAAHDSLSKLGFPILGITEMREEAAKDASSLSGEKFEFQAVDQNGRKVMGTIAAEDLYSAFKRLILEYHFAVEQLYPSSLSPDAKEEQRKRGVVELYTTLKNEQAKQGGNAKNASEQAEKTKEEEGQRTLQQVDFVLQKIESLLKEFDQVIKPEDKSMIQKKADRLTRLKTSKNTDYVKHLAEDLLLYVQNEEIFLTKEKSDKRIESFRIDVKKLMNEIHHEKIGVTLRQDILDSTSSWLAEHLKNNSEPSWWERLLGNIMNFINNLLTEPPEITELKEKIRVLNSQIWDYYKMYIKEDTIEGRKEIKESIRKLKEDKTELKLQLKNLQQKMADQSALPEQQTVGDKLTAELISITGWLLAIYLAMYVVYFYASSRMLPMEINMETLKITQTRSFLTTMLILLVIHAGLRLKTMLNLRKTLGNIILIPGITFSILLIMYNF